MEREYKQKETGERKKKIIDCHLTPPKTSEFLIFKQPEKMKRTTWNTEQGN
jgi:hypothetical protein